MIAPQPFKYKCQKCGYTKVVKLKSDVINPLNFSSICPKCGAEMQRKQLDLFSKLSQLLRE